MHIQLLVDLAAHIASLTASSLTPITSDGLRVAVAITTVIFEADLQTTSPGNNHHQPIDSHHGLHVQNDMHEDNIHVWLNMTMHGEPYVFINAHNSL